MLSSKRMLSILSDILQYVHTVLQSKSAREEDAGDVEEGAEKEQCNICFDGKKPEARVDGCRHTFCVECMHEWSMTQRTCPMCRAKFSKVIYSTCSSCAKDVVALKFIARLDGCMHVFCYKCIDDCTRAGKTSCPTCDEKFEQVISDITKDTCLICFKKASFRSTTDGCLHPFCYRCISNPKKTYYKCPVCRKIYKTILAGIGEDTCHDCLDKVDVRCTSEACHHQFCYPCIKKRKRLAGNCPACGLAVKDVVIPDDKCVLCFGDIQIATSNNGCKHRFCYKCIKDHCQCLGPRCPICLKGFSKLFPSTDHDTCLKCLRQANVRSTTDVCDHPFCYRCISTRKKTDNTCPVCSKTFTTIKAVIAEDTCHDCLGKVNVRCTSGACKHQFCYRCIKKRKKLAGDCPACGVAVVDVVIMDDKCVLCFGDIQIATFNNGCKHRFCYKCIKDHCQCLGPTCPVCLKGFSKLFPTDHNTCMKCLRQANVRSTTNVCDHPFCYRCISTRKKTDNTCPVCSKTFTTIKAVIAEDTCHDCLGKVNVRCTSGACHHQFCYPCIKKRKRLAGNCPACGLAVKDVVIPDDKCVLCFGDIQIATSNNGCKHRFCYKCIKDHCQCLGPRCPICLKGFSKLFPSTDHDTCLKCLRQANVRSTTDVCDHPFCYRCISTRKKTDNTCPVCSKTFTTIKAVIAEDTCHDCLGKVNVRCTSGACKHQFCYRCIKKRKKLAGDCPACGVAVVDVVIMDDKCVLCFGDIQIATFNNGCKHRFCYKCIKDHCQCLGPTCPVCLKGFSKLFPTDHNTCMKCLRQANVRSTTNVCDHPFCYRCISTRKKTDNTCPVCSKTFTTIKAVIAEDTCHDCLGKVNVRCTSGACHHQFCYPCIKNRKHLAGDCPVCGVAVEDVVIPDDKCVLCFGDIQIATSNNGCKHRFCYKCIKVHCQCLGPRCPVCLKGFSKLFPSTDHDTCLKCLRQVNLRSTTDVCDHPFCYRCISTRKEMDYTCPVCSKIYTTILADIAEDTCHDCLGKVDVRCTSGACHHQFCYPCIKKRKRLAGDCPACGVAVEDVVIPDDKCVLCFGDIQIATSNNGCKHRFCYKCIKDPRQCLRSRCPVCLKRFSKLFPSTDHDTCMKCLRQANVRSTTDVCDHPFCFKCIGNWKESSNACPVCKKKFKTILADLGDNTCNICLDEVNIKTTSDGCNHQFCFKCIYGRKMSKKSCPVCSKKFSKLVIHEESNICFICLKEVRMKSTTDVCQHSFCYSCIKNRSDHNTTCPVCSLKFSSIIFIEKP